MEADREWSDRPTSDLIASLRALSQRTPTWTFYTACAERLEALEEIRRDLADSDPFRCDMYDDPTCTFCRQYVGRGHQDDCVWNRAAVLWPSTEGETDG